VRLSKDEIMTYNEYSKMMARRKRAKDAYWNTVLKTLYPVSVLEDAGFKLTPTSERWRGLDYDKDQRSILSPASDEETKLELVVNGALKPVNKLDIYKLTLMERREYEGEEFNRIRVVALYGKDETGQYWLHHLPPFYANASILACKTWLLDMSKDDVLIEAT